MRTRKEVIEELSKAITRRKEADEEIEALNEELKGFDEIPALPTYQDGSLCYHLNEAFNVSGSRIVNPNKVHWNMFHTSEYAEAFSKRVKLLAKLFHCKWYLDRDYKPDWKTEEFKFSIVYLEEAGTFGVSVRKHSDLCTVCFSTQEKAERAAVWMNEHALEEVKEKK